MYLTLKQVWLHLCPPVPRPAGHALRTWTPPWIADATVEPSRAVAIARAMPMTRPATHIVITIIIHMQHKISRARISAFIFVFKFDSGVWPRCRKCGAKCGKWRKGGRVASRAAFLEQLSCRSTCCRAVQRGRGWDAPHIRRRGVGDISSSGSGAARKRALSPPRCRRDVGKVRTPAPVLGLLSSIQSLVWQATGCRGRSGPTWPTSR